MQHSLCPFTTWKSYPAGADARAITPRADTPLLNVAGTLTPNRAGQDDFSISGQHVDATYTNILLHAVEQDYLNGQNEELVGRLTWLKGLLDTITGTPAPSPDAPRYKAQQARLYALARQLDLNLDYFGQFRNHVTLLSVTAYQDTLKSLIRYGGTIERSYLAYQDALQANQINKKALEDTKAAELANAANIKLQLDADIPKQQMLDQNIKDLLNELGELWVQLFNAEAAFKDAVARQGNGCGFGQIVTIAAVVASVVATGGTAAAAIGPALAALKGLQEKDGKTVPVPDTFSGFKYKVKTVATAGQDIASFVQAFGKIKDAITPSDNGSPVPSLPSDEAKIVASAEDIDRQLKPFMSLPEAKDYRRLLHSFVATAEARNNKLLELQALYNAWDAGTAQIRMTEAEAAAVSTDIADLYDPRLMPALLFMEGAYRQSQAAIAKNLYELARAYDYYSLAGSTITIADFSVASLTTTFAALLDQYTSARAAFGMGPARFVDKTVKLSEIVTVADFNRLRTQGQVTFTLPDDHPAFNRLSHVLVTRVWLELKLRTGHVTALNCEFTHHGRAKMFDRTRNPHLFSHVPITIPYEKRADGHEVSSGTIVDLTDPHRDYEGVSPYGPWTIRVHDLPPDALAKVTEAIVHFDGSGRS